MSEGMDMIHDTLELAKNGFKPTNNIRIGHSGDAINLIDELLSDESQKLPIRDYCKQLENGLKALKDALERNII